MITAFVARILILLLGTLYPAYASYKAVKTKNVKEYVKWMMYWIVFALFTCLETIADIMVSFWLPFYYEGKILFVLWLLSPATRGSSILYRKFVHPELCKREKDIDEFISRAREEGYAAAINLGSKGLNYAVTVLANTAIQGQAKIFTQLKKSYSMSELDCPSNYQLRHPTAPINEEVHMDEDSGLEDQQNANSVLQRQKWLSDGTLNMNGDDESARSSARQSPRLRSKSQSGSGQDADEESDVPEIVGDGPRTRRRLNAQTTGTRRREVVEYGSLPRSKSKSRASKKKKTTT